MVVRKNKTLKASNIIFKVANGAISLLMDITHIPTSPISNSTDVDLIVPVVFIPGSTSQAIAVNLAKILGTDQSEKYMESSMTQMSAGEINVQKNESSAQTATKTAKNSVRTKANKQKKKKQQDHYHET